MKEIIDPIVEMFKALSKGTIEGDKALLELVEKLAAYVYQLDERVKKLESRATKIH